MIGCPQCEMSRRAALREGLATFAAAGVAGGALPGSAAARSAQPSGTCDGAVPRR